MTPTAPAAILDVDGTLVDSNYQHALAWFRAFRAQAITLPVWRIHRAIGMGGDQLVAKLAGERVEEECGDALRAAQSEAYESLIGEVCALDGARELIGHLAGEGRRVVLASSASEEEVDHYLDLLDARELVHGWTTSADVAQTKPEPDLVRAALRCAGGGPAVMLGDSVWDCEAARRAEVPVVAVLTGGFSEQELREAGAEAVFDSIDALRRGLPGTPLAPR